MLRCLPENEQPCVTLHPFVQAEVPLKVLADGAGLHLQVATLEAAVTYLQELLPGKAMAQGRAYRDPELLRTISMERTRSGAAV